MSHLPQAQQFVTPCATTDAPLTQSFRAEVSAISAITLYPSVRAGASGPVSFELLAGDAAVEPSVQRLSIEATRLEGDSFTLALPRVEPADGRTFVLRIAASNPGTCVAFRASGISLADADLRSGARPLYGDLLLVVHPHEGTVLHAFQRSILEHTAIRVPLALLAILAVLYASALARLCYSLALGLNAGSSEPGKRSVTATSVRPSDA